MSDHVYLSTGCLHGEHEYCQATYGVMGDKVPAECKFCEAKCVCRCHRGWNDIIEDLVEVWHTHSVFTDDENRGAIPLHTFLGMSWEQYALCVDARGQGWDAVPEGARPYIRAQHERWVEEEDVDERRPLSRG